MLNGNLKKTLLLSICCWQLSGGAYAQEYSELAAWWAPTIDQLFNVAGNAAQANRAQEDTFTVYNFDLDWRANNNWDNLNYYKLKPPLLYYSVVESRQFYYLGYYFYYPRQVSANPHGNDFAGLAMAVEKTQVQGKGRLVGVLLYDDDGWQEIEVNGPADSPVRLTLSAGEHAVRFNGKARPPGGNVLTCNPPQKSVTEGEVTYGLVALDELWRHRGEIAAGANYGTLDYKTVNGSATLKNFPWKWRHKGKLWLSDPAALFRAITGKKALEGDYRYNPYME